MLSDNSVLVLNKSWIPIGINKLESAITKLFGVYKTGEPKAKIIDPLNDFITYTWSDWSQLKPKDNEPVIRTKFSAYRMPEVILLTRYDKFPNRQVPFNRRAIYNRDSYTCFVPDTLILMYDLTFKKISDIIIGDKVIDAYGNEQTVEYVHSRLAMDNEIISLSHRGNGDDICCTKSHKILQFSWDTGSFNPDGVNAIKLTLNSYIAELIPKISVKDIPIIDMYQESKLKYVNCISDNQIKHYCGNPINRFIKLDSDFGKLAGYYLSEGCAQGTSIIFTLHSNEVDYADEIMYLLKNIFGLNSKWTTDGNRGRVIVNSSLLVELMILYFGKTNSKHVGIKDNLEFLNGLLSTVIKGDGGISNEQFRCSLSMSRPNLIREIYLISLICGLRPNISKTYFRQDGRIFKTINFNADDFNKICTMCNFAFKDWHKSKNGNKDRKDVGSRLISKITRIEEVDYKGLVYDLQVSGSHTYVANFVCVHNCQYCGDKPGNTELSIDHVIAKSRGGLTTWQNCVLACTSCNRKKADFDLSEVNMKLLRQPFKPKFSMLNINKSIMPKSWQCFLSEVYWTTELENQNQL